MSSNQCKTGISKNYHWDEDDNDICASISTQEILKKVKNKMYQDEVGKSNNRASSLVSAGFQTANGKKETTLEESQKSAQNFVRESQGRFQEKHYETGMKDIKDRMESSAQTDDTLLALNNESKQTVLKSQNTWQHLNTGLSTLNVPMMFLQKLLFSLNPKKNFRSPNELCETPNRNLLQTETTIPKLSEFLKNAVETSAPCSNRKLPLQEMEKDPNTVLMVKKWRLSGLRRARTSSKK
ncbi:hypothetical protein GQX74_014145 [Glossina fuscipes]|nr:hypothetical protein GQX74_014145 [Glossina fuscipes]